MSRLFPIGLASLLISFVPLASGCENPSAARLVTEPTRVPLEFDPPDLYNGLEAHRVRIAGNALALDVRNWSAGELPGRIVTDVIELNSGAAVTLPTTVSDLTVKTFGAAPPGSKIVTLLRYGPTYFQGPQSPSSAVPAPPKGWTDWQALSELTPGKVSAVSTPLDLATNCYAQLRLDLVSDSATAAPAVKGLVLSFVRQAVRRFEPQIEVTDYKVPRIVRSTIPFGYERMDQKDLAWLRQACKLDAVVADKKTEIDRLIGLMQWASMRKNVRDEAGNKHLGIRPNSDDPYPWDIHKVFDPANGGTVYGHCASYSQLLIAALTAMGWHARHINIEGYRECTHEVVEVWANSLNKWVYLDPSLGTYYTDRKGKPLGILEMHDIFVDYFCQKGKTLKDYLPRVETQPELDKGFQRRQKLDFKDFPAVVRTNDYTYGEKKPWDWKEGQGILSAGFMQLTPRNNFYSQPNPPFVRYAFSPEGVNGFPCWTDEKTPLWHDESDGPKEKHPDGLSRNWFTRDRDWNWTLNQASMKMVRTGMREITVELGTSQPFFRRYVAIVDGGAVEIRSPFVWKLRTGENFLIVNPIDEFDQPGIPAMARVELKK